MSTLRDMNGAAAIRLGDGTPPGPLGRRPLGARRRRRERGQRRLPTGAGGPRACACCRSASFGRGAFPARRRADRVGRTRGRGRDASLRGSGFGTEPTASVRARDRPAGPGSPGPVAGGLARRPARGLRRGDGRDRDRPDRGWRRDPDPGGERGRAADPVDGRTDGACSIFDPAGSRRAWFAVDIEAASGAWCARSSRDDPVGVSGARPHQHDAGRADRYAYSYQQFFSDLFLVEGLRPSLSGSRAGGRASPSRP